MSSFLFVAACCFSCGRCLRDVFVKCRCRPLCYAKFIVHFFCCPNSCRSSSRSHDNRNPSGYPEEVSWSNVDPFADPCDDPNALEAQQTDVESATLAAVRGDEDKDKRIDNMDADIFADFDDADSLSAGCV